MILYRVATCGVIQACQQCGANLGYKLPSLGPAYSVLIHEHPHQLWNAYGGVSVVQLERHLLRECIQGSMSLLEPPYHILQQASMSLSAGKSACIVGAPGYINMSMLG